MTQMNSEERRHVLAVYRAKRQQGLPPTVAIRYTIEVFAIEVCSSTLARETVSAWYYLACFTAARTYCDRIELRTAYLPFWETGKVTHWPARADELQCRWYALCKACGRRIIEPQGGVMAVYERLRALAQKATPGPWTLDGPHSVWKINGGEDDIYIAEPEMRSDAAYIAAASPDVVLSLTADADQARAENDVLQARLDAVLAALGPVPVCQRCLDKHDERSEGAR